MRCMAERVGFEPTSPPVSRSETKNRPRLPAFEPRFESTGHSGGAMHHAVHGGEGGIRTHEPGFARLPAFEAGSFNHSDTSPRQCVMRPA